MSKGNDMRGLLKDKFEAYEVDPGLDLWAGIEAEIRPEKKGWGKWTPFLTVAASILILLSMYILLNDAPYPQGETPFAKQENVPSVQTPQNKYEPQFAEATPSPNTESQTEKVAPAISKETRKRYAIRTSNVANMAEAPITLPSQQVQTMVEPVRSEMELKPISRKSEIKEQSPELVQFAEQKIVNIKPQMPSNGIQGTKNSLNINKLTVNGTLDFVGKELNKWANSPINIYKEEKGNGEVRTFQIKLLDLEITQKTHRKNQKSQKL